MALVDVDRSTPGRAVFVFEGHRRDLLTAWGNLSATVNVHAFLTAWKRCRRLVHATGEEVA